MTDKNSSPFSAKELVEKGELAFNNNDYQEAYTLFHQALGLDPGNVQAYNNIASFYFLQGKQEKAIEVFEFIVDYLEPSQRALDNYFSILEKTNQLQKIQTTIQKLNAKHNALSQEKHIHVITSIAPKNIEMQQLCIQSWINIGVHVSSLNCQEEIDLLISHFPNVEFIRANRDGRNIVKKPMVYFDDITSCFLQSEYEIFGIINSDILLSNDENFVDYIKDTAKNAFIYGSRVDARHLHNLTGTLYTIGYDYFFFNKETLDLHIPSNLMLGVPWWDYWAPYAIAISNYPLIRIDSPVAFHQIHSTNWTDELFKKFGQEMSRIIFESNSKNIKELFPGIKVNYEMVETDLLYSVYHFLHARSKSKKFPSLDEKHELDFRYINKKGETILSKSFTL